MKIKDSNTWLESEKGNQEATKFLEDIYDELELINKDIRNSVSNLTGTYDEIINFFEHNTKISYEGEGSNYNLNNERDSFNVLANYDNQLIKPYFFKVYFKKQNYDNDYFEVDYIEIMEEKTLIYNFEELDLNINDLI